MGAKRPATCEDCGLVKITQRNSFIVWFYNTYYKMICRDYRGSATIDLLALKILCEEMDIGPVDELAKLLQIILDTSGDELLKDKKQEENIDKGLLKTRKPFPVTSRRKVRVRKR